MCRTRTRLARMHWAAFSTFYIVSRVWIFVSQSCTVAEWSVGHPYTACSVMETHGSPIHRERYIRIVRGISVHSVRCNGKARGSSVHRVRVVGLRPHDDSNTILIQILYQEEMLWCFRLSIEWFVRLLTTEVAVGINIQPYHTQQLTNTHVLKSGASTKLNIKSNTLNLKEPVQMAYFICCFQEYAYNTLYRVKRAFSVLKYAVCIGS